MGRDEFRYLERLRQLGVASVEFDYTGRSRRLKRVEFQEMGSDDLKAALNETAISDAEPALEGLSEEARADVIQRLRERAMYRHS